MDEEKPKKTLTQKLLNVFKWGMLICLVLIAVLATKNMTTNNITEECCQKVCDSIGTVCESVQGINIYCSYNYADRGHPEITEIFRFKINKTICQEEKPLVMDKQNISNTNDPPEVDETSTNRSEMPAL